MLGKSAVTTTHAILKDMVNEGKLNVYKKNLQTHLLTINEKNEFNKIYNFLMKIDGLIGKMQSAARNAKITPRKMKTKDSALTEFVKFASTFVQGYYDAGDEMLLRLLVRTKNEIRSEKDSALLYRKAIDILNKLHHYFPRESDILDHIVSVKLKNAKSSPIFGATNVDIDLIDDLIEIIYQFKKMFPIPERKTL